MITTPNIAWLAGLIEGEGSFLWAKSPCISVQMTDRDIIARAAALLGAKVCGPYENGHKPTWAFRVHGSRAVGWMLTLFTFMGERRRAKIAEVIARWREAPGHPKASRGQRLPARCHPERNRVSNGHCQQCYMRDYRAQRRPK